MLLVASIDAARRDFCIFTSHLGLPAQMPDSIRIGWPCEMFGAPSLLSCHFDHSHESSRPDVRGHLRTPPQHLQEPFETSRPLQKPFENSRDLQASPGWNLLCASCLTAILTRTECLRLLFAVKNCTSRGSSSANMMSSGLHGSFPLRSLTMACQRTLDSRTPTRLCRMTLRQHPFPVLVT